MRYHTIGVGIVAKSIPLWSLYSYTVTTPQSPILIMKAPILCIPFQGWKKKARTPAFRTKVQPVLRGGGLGIGGWRAPVFGAF